MSSITLPAELGRQLAQSRESVRVCDVSGNTIGIFTPASKLVPEPNVSEEELNRRETHGPFYTTQQVLDQLRSL